MSFIIFVAAVAIALFIFKKMRQSALEKGRGGVRASAMAGIVSFIAFILLLGTAGNLVSPDKGDASAPASAGATSSGTSLVDSRGVKTGFDLADDFQKSIYNEIRAMPETGNDTDVFNRDRALLLFRQFGVRVADFDQHVKDGCLVGYNRLQAEYRQETQRWLPLSRANFPDLEEETARRDAYNTQLFARLNEEQTAVNHCYYRETQKLPHHVPRQPDTE